VFDIQYTNISKLLSLETVFKININIKIIIKLNGNLLCHHILINII
jgi:hypothetical protein